jgi:hypothetical protein
VGGCTSSRHCVGLDGRLQLLQPSVRLAPVWVVGQRVTAAHVGARTGSPRLPRAIRTCTSSRALSGFPRVAHFVELFLPSLRPHHYSPSAGDRGALTGDGAGHLLPLPAATALPAVCEVEWACPPGHVCDTESSTKVLIDYVTGARSPSNTRIHGPPAHVFFGTIVVAHLQVLCQAGTFAGSGGCIACPRGRYGAVVGVAECALCPASTPYSREGSISVADCVNCDSGCEDGLFGRVLVASNTVLCPVGHVCDGDTGVAVRCARCGCRCVSVPRKL